MTDRSARTQAGRTIQQWLASQALPAVLSGASHWQLAPGSRLLDLWLDEASDDLCLLSTWLQLPENGLPPQQLLERAESLEHSLSGLKCLKHPDHIEARFELLFQRADDLPPLLDYALASMPPTQALLGSVR